MSKKDLTEIVCVIDMSGSMSGTADDARGGFNNFIKEQKALEGDANVTLTLFDTEFIDVHNAVSINDVPELTAETYSPRGMTALLDAIGKTITKVGKRLAETDESERPEKVIAVVITDGYENSSTDFSKKEINEMIATQRDTYNWEFLFLAADQDAIAEGAKLGFTAKQSINFRNTKEDTVRAYGLVSDTVCAYRSNN